MSPPTQAPPRLQIATRDDLATALGISLPKLTFWLYKLSIDHRYKTFELKRWGGRPPRIIEAPIKPIKDIQRRLLSLLAGQYRQHHAVHGYVNSRNIVTNATVHLRQRWVLRVDLADFFPSINFGRVRGLFLAAPFSFSPDVATLLAHICCHRGHLPQGAPTSPLVSNLICRRLDRQLADLALAQRCFYSRYCDDIVFSTNRSAYPLALALTDSSTGSIVAGPALRAIVSANGFTINDSKTRLRGYSQRQIVTGLITNQLVNVPRNEVRSLRNLLHIWSRHGEVAAAASLDRYKLKNRPPQKPPGSFRLIVRGKLQYIGFIKGWDNPVYTALATKLRRLDPTFIPRQSIAEPTPPDALRIFMEGKTDHSHLDAALAHYHRIGSFPALRLIHDAVYQGDQNLLARCAAVATVPNASPLVFIFDRDNQALLPKVTDGGKPFKDWDNNVFSLALPIPPHRLEDKPLCIEMLYTDDVLSRKDGDGRRLYLHAEFDPQTGLHPTETAFCQNIRQRTLVVDNDVFDPTTRKKLSLSKQAFADGISTRRPPYGDVPFDGFKPTLEVLAAILAASRDTVGK